MMIRPLSAAQAVLAPAGCCSLLVLAVLLGFGAPSAIAGPFEEGRLRGSVVVGSGRAYDQQYLLLGLGAGYYVLDGLELGLDGEAWFGDQPGIYRLSPGVRYVLPTGSGWNPYLGGYYRYTLVESEDDFSSAGARIGAMIRGGGNLYFGAGLVYDRLLDCDEEVQDSCTQLYPELQVAFTF